MKRIFRSVFSFMLALIITLCSVSVSANAALSYAGSCGDNLSWSFNDETGVLEISGTGAMDNYAIMLLPWYSVRSEIKTVNVSDGVTSICDYAFFECSSLSSINISASVSSIGSLAFAQCYNLKAISVNENNASYSSDGSGVLFNKLQTELIQYPASSTLTSYEIPDTVKTISEDAFRYAENLTEVSLSSSLETIGEDAFYASALTDISIPASVTSIGKDAFGWCSSLKSVNVDENNSNYSSDEYGVLFSKDKTELIKFPNNNVRTSYEIPDGTTSLTDNSFENCYKLETVAIPSSVVNIGNGVFFNCYLKTITVDAANQNFSNDENGVLFSKDKTELIQYPVRNGKKGYNIPDGVVTINKYAFHNNLAVESIAVPDSVTTINDGAFSLCRNLKYVHVSKNTISIGEDVITNTNTYFCGETEDCYAKEYADANDIEFIVCIGHSATGITISDTEITLTNKESCQLTATVTPDSAADKSVNWSSDNEEVASVDENGKITALSTGNATVTATAADGGYTASCKITVNPRYFDVTWSVDGVETTTPVAEGAEIQAPADPKKTGFTFAGWSPEIPDTMPENNLRFTAKWTVNSYNAVFYSNGGEWSDGSTEKIYSVKYGSQIYAPRNPSKQGYVFAGWSPEIGTMDSVNSKEFNAIWEASTDTKYIVETYTMETDGTYTKHSESLTGTTDTTVNAEYSVSKGFVLNSENSVLSGTVAADGSLVLKVYLDREKYEIILNGEKIECLYGAEISEPQKPDAPEGHLQEGWIDENGNAVTFPLVADENFPAEIKPDFVRQSYTVTWIVDGSTTTDTYLFEAEITAPSAPVKTGYTFIGWTPDVETAMPSHNLEYTAVWSVNSYNAVFDANSGSWKDGADKKTVVTDFDAQIIAPEEPEKAGYIFAGWSPEVGIMNNINGKIYKAEWIPSTETLYTVEIYIMEPDGNYTKTVETLNGATDSTVYAEFTVENGYVLNKDKSVLSGIVLADNSLVLKTYIDRQSYSFTTVADGISTTVSYLYGATVAEPFAPVKEGYDFTGWDKEIPSTMPAEDITVTAKFEKTIYSCPDCPEEFDNKAAYDEHIAYEQAKKNIRVSIKNNPGTKTIKYGETLRLTAVTSAALPDGTKICWYVDGVKTGEGESFEIKFESGTKTITVKITDSSGNALKDSNGAEISASQNVSVNSSIWQKIVSFFKNLFGMNRTIIQKIFR